jgi:hypothetical protein
MLETRQMLWKGQSYRHVKQPVRTLEWLIRVRLRFSTAIDMNCLSMVETCVQCQDLRHRGGGLHQHLAENQGVHRRRNHLVFDSCELTN